MDITIPFKIKFLTIKTKNFAKKKKLIIEELKKHPEERQKNFNSNRGNRELALSFAKIFTEELSHVAKHYRSNLTITDSWSVTYDKGDFHVPHNHGSTGYAGILYLDLHKDSPGTTYIQPWNNENDKSLLYTPKVKPGDMVIVPKFIFHYSEVNPISFKKRIISFDFGI